MIKNDIKQIARLIAARTIANKIDEIEEMLNDDAHLTDNEVLNILEEIKVVASTIINNQPETLSNIESLTIPQIVSLRNN